MAAILVRVACDCSLCAGAMLVQSFVRGIHHKMRHKAGGGEVDSVGFYAVNGTDAEIESTYRTRITVERERERILSARISSLKLLLARTVTLNGATLRAQLVAGPRPY